MTDENLDVTSFIRWDVEVDANLKQLSAVMPIFKNLHDQYNNYKEASTKFHSRSVVVHQITQIITSALQLFESSLAIRCSRGNR